MDLQSSLNDYLNQQDNDQWKVKDESSADWALRKIKEHEDEIKRINDFAEQEVSKIEDWAKGEVEQHKRNIDYFQGKLAEYAMNLKEEDDNFKSLKLPNGRVRFRKQQPQWKYDDKTLIQSLKRSGMTDYIKVEEKPVKNDIKKVLEVVDGKAINPETGEVVEGIEVVERGERVEVIANE